jgi:hypothetical protein
MDGNNKVTDKTQEQLMQAAWQDLTADEKALRADLIQHPDMSWEQAIELSKMSPL